MWSQGRCVTKPVYTTNCLRGVWIWCKQYCYSMYLAVTYLKLIYDYTVLVPQSYHDTQDGHVLGSHLGVVEGLSIYLYNDIIMLLFWRSIWLPMELYDLFYMEVCHDTRIFDLCISTQRIIYTAMMIYTTVTSKIHIILATHYSDVAG